MRNPGGFSIGPGEHAFQPTGSRESNTVLRKTCQSILVADGHLIRVPDHTIYKASTCPQGWTRDHDSWRGNTRTTHRSLEELPIDLADTPGFYSARPDSTTHATNASLVIDLRPSKTSSGSTTTGKRQTQQTATPSTSGTTSDKTIWQESIVRGPTRKWKRPSSQLLDKGKKKKIRR